MKIGVMILLALVIIMAMCFVLSRFDASNFITNENKMSNPEVPPTWNLDWQGGPGFDRFKILHEKGPYNPHGFIESD
jgi:hypothetical protein